MKLLLQRLQHTSEETVGKLSIDGKFACYILEDQPQKVKVKHETRIPAGTYKIKLRTFGGFHEKYKVKFPKIHKGMLWLQDVPNFDSILMHLGNTDDNSSGCLLFGTNINTHNGRITVTESTKAYTRVYPEIAREIEKGNEVTIEIKDELL